MNKEKIHFLLGPWEMENWKLSNIKWIWNQPVFFD